MKTVKIVLPGCLILFAAQAGRLHAAASEPLTQITIDVIANGKNAAEIVLPAGAKLQIKGGSLDSAADNENVLHAKGAVSVSAKLNDADLGTVYADELVLTKETVNPGWASARTGLETMLAEDQAARNKLVDASKRRKLALDSPELAPIQKEIDAVDQRNQVRLDEIVKLYGWPGTRIAGPDGAAGAFLVVQHADLAYQRKYLPLLREAAAKRQLPRSDLALLEDRIRIREGKPQIYGTQLHFDKDGKNVLEPIEDETHVDLRRAEVGLPPLAEYLKQIDAMYKN